MTYFFFVEAMRQSCAEVRSAAAAVDVRADFAKCLRVVFGDRFGAVFGMANIAPARYLRIAQLRTSDCGLEKSLSAMLSRVVFAVMRD